ncbi:aminotransferase class I/II-fold pyridoxal phosphate-dependent enzyme [Escherichia coli]
MVCLGERAKEAIIIVEGIYSMLGDVAPLAEIVDIKRRLGGYLIVDEAHLLAVSGATVRDRPKPLALKMMWILSFSAFSKNGFSLAVLLSVRKRWKCCATQPPGNRHRCPSPSCIATVRSSLRTIATQPELRQKLMDNANHLYDG